MFHFNNHLSSIQHDNYTSLLKDRRMFLEVQQYLIPFMKCSWTVPTNYLSISTVCQQAQLKINCDITRLHLMVPSSSLNSHRWNKYFLTQLLEPSILYCILSFGVWPLDKDVLGRDLKEIPQTNVFLQRSSTSWLFQTYLVSRLQTTAQFVSKKHSAWTHRFEFMQSEILKLKVQQKINH